MSLQSLILNQPKLWCNARANNFKSYGKLIITNGPAVTQQTSTITAVTSNVESGLITTFQHIDGGGNGAVFTLNNSKILAGDSIFCIINSYSGTGIPYVSAFNVVNGSCSIFVGNLAPAGTPLNSTITFKFFVFHNS